MKTLSVLVSASHVCEGGTPRDQEHREQGDLAMNMLIRHCSVVVRFLGPTLSPNPVILRGDYLVRARHVCECPHVLRQLSDAL